MRGHVRGRRRQRRWRSSGHGARCRRRSAPRPVPPRRRGGPAPSRRPDQKKNAQGAKKERKLLKDAHRPLDSWERYRALTDVLDDAIELVDLADHKARFALVIMARSTSRCSSWPPRTDSVDAIPTAGSPGWACTSSSTSLIALYFFLQAIESLRPRKNQPQVRYFGETGLEDHPLGLRFYEDILSRDLEAYRRAWREMRIGQLNNEVAVQAHALAEINRAKYRALGRLYFGLQLMTMMAVLFLAVGSYFVLSGRRGG